MEYSLRPTAQARSTPRGSVLILILMEYSLRQNIVEATKKDKSS